MHKLLKFLALVFLTFCVGVVDLAAQYDKDVFYMRGRQALSEGKYALAIENFNVLSQLDTADYWTFFFRGIAKYNLGDLRGAKQDFDRSASNTLCIATARHLASAHTQVPVAVTIS